MRICFLSLFSQVACLGKNHPLMWMEKSLKKSLPEFKGGVLLAVTKIPSLLKYCPFILHIGESKIQKENIPKSLQNRFSSACFENVYLSVPTSKAPYVRDKSLISGLVQLPHPDLMCKPLEPSSETLPCEVIYLPSWSTQSL